MQRLQGTGIKMEEQDLNQKKDRRQEVLAGAPSQQIKQEPNEGLQEGWESQWQEFLKTMQASHVPWKKSVEDSKAIQVSFREVAHAKQWLREEDATQSLPGLCGGTHKTQDPCMKVKEEIADEDTSSLEVRCQRFRHFSYQEAEGPRDACHRLQECCSQWLAPERRTKEQILELVILEQFLKILPPEMQSWVREHGPEDCSQAVALAESFLLKLQRTERQEQTGPGLSKEVVLNSHKSEQNISDTTEVHLFLEAKQEYSEASLVVSDGQVRAKEGNLQLESPDCVNVSGISLNAAERTFSQSPEGEEMPGNPKGPKHHQESPPGKPAEQAIRCKEHDRDVNESSFQDRAQMHRRAKTALKCGESLSQAFIHFDHRRMQKGEKLFKCSYCGKVSNGRTNLMIHERTHTGEKPYECCECGKSFSTSSNLINHKRVHTGEKPYKCSGCGQNFSHNASLIRHRRTHTGEKPYECSDCGKSFIQKGELIAHKRTHTGEKPYGCSECGRSFSTSSHLIRHKRVHTGAKPHSHSDCGRGFHRKSSLIMHKGLFIGEKQ